MAPHVGQVNVDSRTGDCSISGAPNDRTERPGMADQSVPYAHDTPGARGAPQLLAQSFQRLLEGIIGRRLL